MPVQRVHQAQTSEQGPDRHQFSVHGDKKWKCIVCFSEHTKARTYMDHLKDHAAQTLECGLFGCKRQIPLRSLQVHQTRARHGGAQGSGAGINSEISATKSDEGAIANSIGNGTGFTGNKHEYALEGSSDQGRLPPGFRRVQDLYKCPMCTNTYVQSSDLERHLFSHTGEKPHACDWPNCGRAFSQAGSLKDHKRTHTNEKPYACGIGDCTRNFAVKRNCRTHQLTHANVRPHACELPGCGRRFARKETLTRHMNSKSG